MKKLALASLLTFGVITGYWFSYAVDSSFRNVGKIDNVCGAPVVDQETLYHVVVGIPEMSRTFDLDLRMLAIESDEPLNAYCLGKEAVAFSRKSPSKEAQLIVYNKNGPGIILFYVVDGTEDSPEILTLFLFGKAKDSDLYGAIGVMWPDAVVGLNDLFDTKIEKAVPIVKNTMMPLDNLLGFLGEITSGQFPKFMKRNEGLEV